MEDKLARLKDKVEVMSEDEIEKVLAHYLKPKYGWHFEAPYLGYSFEPIKIIAYALSNKIPKPKKIEKEEIKRTMDNALGYGGVETKMTWGEIDKITNAIQKLLEEKE